MTEMRLVAISLTMAVILLATASIAVAANVVSLVGKAYDGTAAICQNFAYFRSPPGKVKSRVYFFRDSFYYEGVHLVYWTLLPDATGNYLWSGRVYTKIKVDSAGKLLYTSGKYHIPLGKNIGGITAQRFPYAGANFPSGKFPGTKFSGITYSETLPPFETADACGSFSATKVN